MKLILITLMLLTGLMQEYETTFNHDLDNKHSYLLSRVIDRNQESLSENRQVLQYFVNSLYSLIDIGRYTETGYVTFVESWLTPESLEYRPLVTAAFTGSGLMDVYRFYDRQGNLFTSENSTFIGQNNYIVARSFNILDLNNQENYIVIVNFYWSHSIEHHFWMIIDNIPTRILYQHTMWGTHFIQSETGNLYNIRLWNFTQLADVYRVNINETGIELYYIGTMQLALPLYSPYRPALTDNFIEQTLFSNIRPSWYTGEEINWQSLTTSPYRPTFVNITFTELLSLSELEENLLQTAIQNYLETPQLQIPHGVVPISRHIPGFFRTTANLRIRQYPTTDSDTLFIIPMGIVLELQEHNHHRVETPTGNWYRLHHSFQITDDMPDYWFLGERPTGRVFITGYVYGGFLEPTT